MRAKVPRHRLRRRLAPGPDRVGRADREALGPHDIRSATRSARRAGRPTRHFASPTLETLVLPRVRPRRRAPRGAGPARRAGPADRLRQDDLRRDLRLAVRRGSEGGDPRDPRRRLPPGGRLRRDDADLHRAAGGRIARAALASSFLAAWGCGWRRPAGLRRRVQDRGRAGLAAAGVLQGGRGRGPRDPAAGPEGLGGPRLHGDDDALRLPGQAQSRPPALRQEHVEHRARTTAS